MNILVFKALGNETRLKIVQTLMLRRTYAQLSYKAGAPLRQVQLSLEPMQLKII